MTVPTRQRPLQNPREKKPQMTEPRADGPTSTNHLPTVAESTPVAGWARRAKRQFEKFQTRVEFDNYKASYLRM
jgi:hypothetical protein